MTRAEYYKQNETIIRHAWFGRNHEADWFDWCSRNAETIFHGGDWWKWLPGIGKAVDIRCQGHLVGLKMAFEKVQGVQFESRIERGET